MELSRRKNATPTWVVGLVGLSIAVGLALKALVPNHMDPSVFLALGKQAPIQTEYARELLGEVRPRSHGGHDGKYFFAQANDPWFLHPEANAAVLDRPIYRGQRMLYPMLAGGLGLFPPTVVVWAMLVINLLGIGIGSLIAASLAVRWGASPWLGLSVPLNLGLVFEVNVGGAGIVAYVCCLGAVYALATDREWAAAALFGCAALAREVMLIFAVGVFLLVVIEEGRRLWRMVVVPLGAVLVWQLYLQLRLAAVPGVGGGPKIFAAPLVGFWEAARDWLRQPDDLFLNGAIVALVVVFTIRAFQTRLSLAWGALPFVFLTVILSVDVWREPFDLARALTPVFTAAAFLFFVDREPTAERADDHAIPASSRRSAPDR